MRTPDPESVPLTLPCPSVTTEWQGYRLFRFHSVKRTGLKLNSYTATPGVDPWHSRCSVTEVMKKIVLLFDTPFSHTGSIAAEILVAIMIIGIGILGLSGAMMGPGSVGAIEFGYTSIVRSAMISTASFLASGRLEAMKNTPYTSSSDLITAAQFPNEAYQTIAGYPGYRRSVTIQTDVPTAGLKTVTVQVFFTPPSSRGVNPEEGVQVQTILARRP